MGRQQPSFHGSVKKKKKRKKKKRRNSSRKRKGKKRRSKGSGKSSKGSTRSSSSKRSKKGSRKGSKTRSKSGSPKKSKKGSKHKKSKSKRKKSKEKGKKRKGGDKTPKKETSTKKTVEEKLPGNRKEVPPLRLGIDVLGFHDIYINQIDVDPVEEEEFISAGDSPYTTAGTATLESSDHGPVDPKELTKALEDVQKSGQKKKEKGSKSRGSSRGSKKGRKSRSRSRSRKSSKGSKKGSKRSSKKGSKRGSKKGSRSGSKKGSPKKKKKSKSGSKSPKGKKDKSGSKTPKSKADKTPAAAGTDMQADTWSVASETTIKRGRALMLTEIPRRIITHFQGNPIKIRVERYGGKRHNNGEVIPVGSVTVPFPSDWSEAILEVQREMNPKTYDSLAFPIMRGLTGRYAVKDNNNEHIGDIKLEMNLYCYANSAVSKLFPTDATLYDALVESENIAKCCDRMVNKTRKGRKRLDGKMGPETYYGWRPGAVPESYAVQGGSNAGGMQGDYVGSYSARREEQSGQSPGGGETPRYDRREPGVGAYETTDEVGGGLSGDYFDIYPRAKKVNYTETFHL